MWNGPTRCSPAYDLKFSRTISEMMRRGGGRFGACCCCCKGASCGSMAARERERNMKSESCGSFEKSDADDIFFFLFFSLFFPITQEPKAGGTRDHCIDFALLITPQFL